MVAWVKERLGEAHSCQVELVRAITQGDSLDGNGPLTESHIDAPMSCLGVWNKELHFLFPGVRNGDLSGLLGCGQDRDGPRGQALMRSCPAGQVRGPGAADGSLEGQHLDAAAD